MEFMECLFKDEVKFELFICIPNFQIKSFKHGFKQIHSLFKSNKASETSMFKKRYQ